MFGILVLVAKTCVRRQKQQLNALDFLSWFYTTYTEPCQILKWENMKANIGIRSTFPTTEVLNHGLNAKTGRFITCSRRPRLAAQQDRQNKGTEGGCPVSGCVPTLVNAFHSHRRGSLIHNHFVRDELEAGATRGFSQVIQHHQSLRTPCRRDQRPRGPLQNLGEQVNRFSPALNHDQAGQCFLRQ